MKINSDEVYWNSNHTKYAVLVSPGYGAGWGTWNSSENNRIAWDKRIVEFIIRMKERGDEVFKCACDSYNPEYDETEDGENNVLGFSEEHKEFLRVLDECGIDSKYVYFGGAYDIEVHWVKPGDLWRISEYDGAELLEFFNDKAWLGV